MKTFNEFENNNTQIEEARRNSRKFETSDEFENAFHEAYSILQSSAMMDWARQTDINYSSGNVERLRRIHAALDSFYNGLSDE